MVALKTFLNLSEDRQREVLAVSMEEFVLHGYAQASLSAIIARLGLAKGSFYRYFEGKQTLYAYLLTHCSRIRMAHDQAGMPPEATDFSRQLRYHFMAKLHFDQSHPLESAFLHTALREKNGPEALAAVSGGKALVLNTLRENLISLQQQGMLRNDLPADMLAFTLLELQVMMQDYLASRYAIDYSEQLRLRKPLYPVSEEELGEVADMFIRLLTGGIFPNPIHP